MKASAGSTEARAVERIQLSERQAKSAKVASEASKGTQIAQQRVPTPRKTPNATSAAAPVAIPPHRRRAPIRPGEEQDEAEGDEGERRRDRDVLVAEHRIAGPDRDRQQRGGAPDGGESIARQRPHGCRRRRARWRARSAPWSGVGPHRRPPLRDLADALDAEHRVEQVGENVERGAVDERRRLDPARTALPRRAGTRERTSPSSSPGRSAERGCSRRPRARTAPLPSSIWPASRTRTRQETTRTTAAAGPGTGAAPARRNGDSPEGAGVLRDPGVGPAAAELARDDPIGEIEPVGGISVGVAIAHGAVIGLPLGILVSVTTDIRLVPEIGLAHDELSSSAPSLATSPRPGSSSSLTTRGGPLRCATSTGTISALNFRLGLRPPRAPVRLGRECVLRPRARSASPWRTARRSRPCARCRRDPTGRRIIESMTCAVAHAVALARLGQQVAARCFIDSMPPATTMSASPVSDGVARRTSPPSGPSRRPCSPSRAPTDRGCRRWSPPGAPAPVPGRGRTQPMYHLAIARSSPAAPPRASASLMATPPSFLGPTPDASAPIKIPIGVRAAETITTSFIASIVPRDGRAPAAPCASASSGKLDED